MKNAIEYTMVLFSDLGSSIRASWKKLSYLPEKESSFQEPLCLQAMMIRIAGIIRQANIVIMAV